MTNGRFITRVLMLMTYSPTKPMNNNSTALKKNRPMINGAKPAEKRSQYISFNTR